MGDRTMGVATLHEGYMYKLDRKLTGRPQLRKNYCVLNGAMLLCYKSPEAWQRRERPEKVCARS
jgi:hypothetical protein